MVALPLEIISKVLSHVSRRTLLSALTVNSTFKNAGLPLLYRHFYFQPNRTRKRGQIKEDLLHHVKVLDIFDHSSEDCAKLIFEHSPEVIRIHFDSTISTLHCWHGDSRCPLLNLKPESVVFVDFTATKAPPDPKQAAKTRIYPDAKHRVLMWDVSDDFDTTGYGTVKEILFPTEKDDLGLTQRCTAIRKGTGGLPKPDDLTRSEVIILSNSKGRNTYGGHFWTWVKAWVRSHTRKKHVLVNLQALKPRDTWFIDSTEESLWKWCANTGEELNLPRGSGDEYRNIDPLFYSNWPRVEEYRTGTLKFLTDEEFKTLLPPKKEAAAKTKKSSKAKKA